MILLFIIKTDEKRHEDEEIDPAFQTLPSVSHSRDITLSPRLPPQWD